MTHNSLSQAGTHPSNNQIMSPETWLEGGYWVLVTEGHLLHSPVLLISPVPGQCKHIRAARELLACSRP